MTEELNGTSLLAGYYVHILNEDALLDVDIPTHKVENGVNLTDHVERKAKVVRLTGLLIRPTTERVEHLVTKLYAIEGQGKLVTYKGRRTYKDMLMSGLDIKASADILNGYKFTVTLTEARIGKTSYVQPKTKATTTKVQSAGRKETQNKKSTSAVQYHVVKRGDTYSGLAKKYGVTIQSLRKLNKYEDRKIPIGVKLRIR